MILAWIAGTIFVLSLAGIVAILVRKFPLAASVDTASAPHAELKKAEIVEKRLRRKFTSLWSTVAERSRPMTTTMGTLMSKTQSKLRDLEHEYKARSIPVLLDRRQRRRLNADIQNLLDQAEALLTEGEQKAAEEKCLQAIRLEPRSVPSFDLLGQLYLRSKEYAHAKEVYRYLEKLTEEADALYDHHSEEANQIARDQKQSLQVRYYEGLAESHRGIDDIASAFTAIQEAYRLAPTNPKVIDFYLDIAIADGKKAFAASALEHLKVTNPENTKIPDWEAAIANLSDTHLTTKETVPTE